MKLLDLPESALEGVTRALPGNAKKPLRAVCRELRAAANATTDFVRVDLTNTVEPERVAPIPASFLRQLRTVQLDIRCHSTSHLPSAEAMAALNIQGAHGSCGVRVVVAGRERGDRRGGSTDAGFASVHFGLLAAALRRARLLGRVRELRYACERWLGPEVSFGEGVRVAAHVRLCERDSRLNAKLLRATLAQPGLFRLAISDVLPQDLDADLAALLSERRDSLQSLSLRACELMDHDPDMPLIFDLHPLALAALPKLRHFELDSAYQGLVAVDGLPALLGASAERLPNLASLTLNGLSLVPLSSPPVARRSLSSRHSPPRAPPRLGGVRLLRGAAGGATSFIGLRRLELSASHFGDLAGLCALPGLERLILRTVWRPDAHTLPAELAGHELAPLPRLASLVLDCVRCLNGLRSDSLRAVELINGTLRQVLLLTDPGRGAPNLATVLVRQRSRASRERPDPNLARVFAGLTMLLRLGGSGAQAALPVAGGAAAASELLLGASVSIHGGAWRFASPYPEECTACKSESADVCAPAPPANFRFRLLRSA